VDLARVAPFIRCPICRASLVPRDEGFVCASDASHAVRKQNGILQFSEPDPGKYDSAYAERYAALWAFGCETLHSGLDEGLYRTISSFLAEALVAAGRPEPVIVDAGCGVGRVASDAARLAGRGIVLALDASPAMLEFAGRIVAGESMDIVIPKDGFSSLRIARPPSPNVVLSRADVEDFPLVDGCADIVLSVNIVDRLPHGPEAAFRECHRILRGGGTLIFTDPFNWIEPWLWQKYPDAAGVLRLLKHSGFAIETWFDDLLYREIADGRGSFNEFKTLAVKARKA
jgi:SAM-dependent methyltransferase